MKIFCNDLCGEDVTCKFMKGRTTEKKKKSIAKIRTSAANAVSPQIAVRPDRTTLQQRCEATHYVLALR